jgi:hypothetical protein
MRGALAAPAVPVVVWVGTVWSEGDLVPFDHKLEAHVHQTACMLSGRRVGVPTSCFQLCKLLLEGFDLGGEGCSGRRLAARCCCHDRCAG